MECSGFTRATNGYCKGVRLFILYAIALLQTSGPLHLIDYRIPIAYLLISKSSAMRPAGSQAPARGHLSCAGTRWGRKVQWANGHMAVGFVQFKQRLLLMTYSCDILGEHQHQ